jgi:His/Glu/Gln/Arg/opine family amino acid ABC transporter permease subunit
VNAVFQVPGEALSDLPVPILITLFTSLVAGVIAMLLAIPTAFARLSRVTLIRSVATFYVETIRGTPLLLQLFVWGFGVSILLSYLFGLILVPPTYSLLNNVLTVLNSNNQTGNLFSLINGAVFVFATFGLGFNYGAYMSEVIRSGIESIDPGQIEASHTLGLSGFQTARLIILPQALRIMIPPLTNNFITLIQDSAFISILGVTELSLKVQGHVQSGSNALIRWEWFAIELAIYFVLCYSLALVSRWYEARSAHTLAGAH